MSNIISNQVKLYDKKTIVYEQLEANIYVGNIVLTIYCNDDSSDYLIKKKCQHQKENL
jgi:hypothetical protein